MLYRLSYAPGTEDGILPQAIQEPQWRVGEPESKFAATAPGSSSYPNSEGNELMPGRNRATKPRIVRMKATKFISVFS